MENYQILIDTWEGQGDLKEELLAAGKVAGIITRINSISGGHHMDDTFTTQWKQSEGFIRWPYFIYNPWATGEENFNWLADHLPDDTTMVSADIEVRRADYSKTAYAEEVQDFIERLESIVKVNIYTGAWFLSYLEYWPKNVEYWWAQYPYAFWYEGQTTTWERVHQEAAKLKWPPYNSISCPGTVMLWQCSGDKLVLPGANGRPLDINIWYGTMEQLAAWVGQKVPVSKPTFEERLSKLETLANWAKEEAKKYGIIVPD